MGFLSVSDLGTIGKAVAIVSTFASLGSIIVGVFSIWRHQTNTHRSAAVSLSLCLLSCFSSRSQFSYMHNAQHNPLGFEGHAMLLSLPPVLLVWAIIAFSAAVIAYALQNVTNLDGINDAPTWIVLAVFMLTLMIVSIGLYTFSTIWKWQSATSMFELFNRWRRHKSEDINVT